MPRNQLRGTTGYCTTEGEDLTFTLCFDPDGAYDGLDSVREGAVEFGTEQATQVFYGLTEAERERIKAECWESAQLDEEDEP